MSVFKMTKTVLKSIFRRPCTVKYPFGPRVYHGEITRGKIGIDIEECVFCGLCQKKCPTYAIEVEREKKFWAIDRLRCITCGACVEGCPKKCLSMERDYSEPVTDKGREVFQNA